MRLLPLSAPLALGVAGLLAIGAGAAARLDDTPLEAIERQLQTQPNDIDLLRSAAETALAEEQTDTALWYAELARLTATGTKDEKSAEARVKTMRGELKVDVPSIGRAVDGYSKAILDFAKACGRQRYYANAADALGALEGTIYERDARSALEKLFKKSTAVEAMLQSGVPVKVEVRQRRSDAEIAKLDKRHAEWEEAFELKGTNYTVKTNMGVEMADAILNAMEQMNRFYRTVFEHKERGGKMNRCEVRVWKTRAEFDQHNPDTKPTVGGFFRPGENSVSTYDPRTATGFMKQGIEELWSTLYHEASHQFTRAVWTNAIPTWLNEGTASYFEGAALLPGGFVETNRIPESRLLNLVVGLGGRAILQGKDLGPDPDPSVLTPDVDDPSLTTVVGYQAPGSYPGEFYAYGWGLVYFCMNYEDENSERIYEPIYKSFMRSYTESDKRSPVKRFTDFFIDEPAFEGIATFEDFERRFRNWVFQLATLEFRGPEQADKLIARAEKQMGNGKFAYAAESLRWALRKRPGDPKALLLLGQCYEELDNDDAALFMFRELLEASRLAAADAQLPGFGGTGSEAREAAIAGMKRVNDTLGEMAAAQVPTLVEIALEEALEWTEAGYPRLGMQALALASEAVGGASELSAKAEAIAEEWGTNIQRSRQLAIADDLEGWDVFGGGWKVRRDGDQVTLINTKDEYAEATLRRVPPKLFRFEVDVKIPDSEEMPILGLVFAGGADSGSTFACIGRDGRFGLLVPDPETGNLRPDRKGFERGSKLGSEPFTMAIEVGARSTVFLVNGEVVGEKEVPAKQMAGEIGFRTFGQVEFSSPRLVY